MKQHLINAFIFFIGIFIFLLISIVATTNNIIYHIFYGGLTKYATNLWLAFDQLANASLGKHHDTTISGTLGYKKLNNDLNKFEKVIVWFLDKVDTNHAINSIEEDEDYKFNTKDNK